MELARAAAKAKAGRPRALRGRSESCTGSAADAPVSEVAALLLGNRLVADTGEWGTFAWTAHVLGAPGCRIAGGTDEIQKNTIAERALGLPREPRQAPSSAGAQQR